MMFPYDVYKDNSSKRVYFSGEKSIKSYLQKIILDFALFCSDKNVIQSYSKIYVPI